MALPSQKITFSVKKKLMQPCVAVRKSERKQELKF